MNKRIKELAEQAMATRKHVPPVWQMYDVEMEKFAELIIKECAMIADDGFGSAHFGLGISGKMLKDHFEIKE